MAAENRASVIGLILDSEGGYSNDPRDPGLATQMGVTQKTLEAWRKHAVTEDDVKNLTREEAAEIYTVQYLDPIMFDDLPIGVDFVVADCSVNSGPSRAVKLLQQVLGFETVQTDGIMGQITLAAVKAVPNKATLITDYCNARLTFMATLKGWGPFGKGWTTRVRSVRSDALDMEAGHTMMVGMKLPAEAQAKASGAVKLTSTRSGLAALAVTGSTALATAGTVAQQATTFLSGYSDYSAIKYVLLGLACLSALGTLGVAIQRVSSGSTT